MAREAHVACLLPGTFPSTLEFNSTTSGLAANTIDEETLRPAIDSRRCSLNRSRKNSTPSKWKWRCTSCPNHTPTSSNAKSPRTASNIKSCIAGRWLGGQSEHCEFVNRPRCTAAFWGVFECSKVKKFGGKFYICFETSTDLISDANGVLSKRVSRLLFFCCNFLSNRHIHLERRISFMSVLTVLSSRNFGISQLRARLSRCSDFAPLYRLACNGISAL